MLCRRFQALYNIGSHLPFTICFTEAAKLLLVCRNYKFRQCSVAGAFESGVVLKFSAAAVYRFTATYSKFTLRKPR